MAGGTCGRCGGAAAHGGFAQLGRETFAYGVHGLQHFIEGDEVKAGDLLFSLDARAIEAQIRQAEANLARDRITLANARRDAARYQTLAQSDFVARQKLERVLKHIQGLQMVVGTRLRDPGRK